MGSRRTTLSTALTLLSEFEDIRRLAHACASVPQLGLLQDQRLSGDKSIRPSIH